MKPRILVTVRSGCAEVWTDRPDAMSVLLVDFDIEAADGDSVITPTEDGPAFLEPGASPMEPRYLDYWFDLKPGRG